MMRIAPTLGLAMALLGALVPGTQAAPKGYAVGDKVANFSFPTTTGKVAKLSDYKGKVVVMQIFSHW